MSAETEFTEQLVSMELFEEEGVPIRPGEAIEFIVVDPEMEDSQ